jgi:hypothetical protein
MTTHKSCVKVLLTTLNDNTYYDYMQTLWMTNSLLNSLSSVEWQHIKVVLKSY